MYKNQLQELAQRSCFNLPSYTCIREGPDHAPRFKATVNFNGEIFESPSYCSTLRQAEHSAAEVALGSLSHRGPSHSLAARILVPSFLSQDETGVYKNLLQEIAQRVSAPLPQYTTYRSGLGHQPVFTGIVELAGITFTGDPAKNKKQAEKNAAMAAWSSLKQLAKEESSSSPEPESSDELEQITIARALQNYRMKEMMTLAHSSSSKVPIPFQKKFAPQSPRPTSPQPAPVTTSRILPLIYPKTTRNRSMMVNTSNERTSQHCRATATTASDRFAPPPRPTSTNDRRVPGLRQPPNALDLWAHQKLHTAAATGANNPYIHMQQPFSVQPVTIRHAVPCQQPSMVPTHQAVHAPPMGRNVIPVTIRQAVPVFAAAPSPAAVKKEFTPPSVQIEPKEHPAESKKDCCEEVKKDSCVEVNKAEDKVPPTAVIPAPPSTVADHMKETCKKTAIDNAQVAEDSKVGQSLDELKNLSI
ncbi:unnamed protein product [Linum tenue]|uniref:DRBM domain-containing protein n=1 Tax=Linum tenue TaxID=586396 RepID=A0AAV0N3E7_9ROSI|nr:unnamed protein product [Linum tenue]